LLYNTFSFLHSRKKYSQRQRRLYFNIPVSPGAAAVRQFALGRLKKLFCEQQNPHQKQNYRSNGDQVFHFYTSLLILLFFLVLLISQQHNHYNRNRRYNTVPMAQQKIHILTSPLSGGIAALFNFYAPAFPQHPP
jgi:hypothetical protein